MAQLWSRADLGEHSTVHHLLSGRQSCDLEIYNTELWSGKLIFNAFGDLELQWHQTSHSNLFHTVDINAAAHAQPQQSQAEPGSAKPSGAECRPGPCGSVKGPSLENCFGQGKYSEKLLCPAVS